MRNTKQNTAFERSQMPPPDCRNPHGSAASDNALDPVVATLHQSHRRTVGATYGTV